MREMRKEEGFSRGLNRQGCRGNGALGRLERMRRPDVRDLFGFEKLELLLVFVVVELAIALLESIAERSSPLRCGAHFAHGRADEARTAAHGPRDALAVAGRREETRRRERVALLRREERDRVGSLRAVVERHG